MNVITTYFEKQLILAGFPAERFQTEWSLSHCQGDGMAFYGRLSFDDLVVLHSKINSNDKRKQRMFERLIRAIQEWDYNETFEIVGNNASHRYAHYNTMVLNICEANGLRFFNEGKEDWYFPTSKKTRYMTLWDDFIESLSAYIKDLSQQLERDGYRLLDAIPYQTETVYRFQTANYEITLLAHETDALEAYSNEDAQWIAEDILVNHCKFADFEAKVIDRDTGIVLSESTLAQVSYHENDPLFGGIRSKLIGNAIRYARAVDGLIARQAKLMHKHLHLAA